MVQTLPEDFRIDISHEQSFRYLQAKQLDHNSRTRRLIITDNNIPKLFNGKELITLSLWINGNNYSNTTCQFGNDGFPYVTFTEDMLKYEGDVSCELRIWDSGDDGENTANNYGIGNITTSFTFNITVSKSLLNRDRLVASSEFNILNDLIIQAITIPDLIKEFKLSAEEVNTLIEKIKADILNYSSQFTEIKNQYTNDFNELLEQINTNIVSYQSEFNSLKSDITNFQSIITQWYISAQESENIRIENDLKRQQDTNNAITKINDTITNANSVIKSAQTAISDAIEAKNTAITQANYAKEQGDRVDAAIEGLEQAIVDVYGGNAFTIAEDYDDDFYGGNA